MADFSYTPTRELVDGSPGLITSHLTACDRKKKTVGQTHTALSGASESVLQRIETEWSIASRPFDVVDLEYWREFGASCANGEEFIADLSDISGAPVAPFVGRLKRDSFQDSRYESLWFQVKFTIIEV